MKTRHLPILITLALAACRTTPAPRLYEGFDGYHRDVTTRSPEAQRFFDQGLQLLYGFNHDEAVRSFQAAARLDPDASWPGGGSPTRAACTSTTRR
jgi:glutamine cyclotransferase